MKGLLKKYQYMLLHNAYMFVVVLGMMIFLTVCYVVSNLNSNEAAETADALNTLPVVSWGFMFIGVIGISFSQMDNMSKWSTTVHTLPYKRSEIVSAEYIGVIFLQICISLFSFLIMMILKILGLQYSWNDILSLTLVSAGLGLLPMMLFYPIITRLKSSGAKPIFGGSCGFITVMGMFAVGHFYEKASEPLIFSLIFYASSALLYALSWLLSLRIMKNKDII